MKRFATVSALSLLLCSLWFKPALGQIIFSEEITYDVGYPQWIESADVDGDGDNDVVAVNHSSSLGDFSFSVMFNDGTGAFPLIVKTPTPFQSAGGDLMDFDGDGDEDLVLATCCFTSDQIYLLANDGLGNFTQCGSLTSAWIPGILASGDFNSDGRQDIANRIYPAGDVAVFLNLGGCAFAPAVIYPVGPTIGVGSLHAADLDGDHDVDLAAVNNAAGTLHTLINDGMGNFVVVGSYVCGPNATNMDAADFDRDGDIDLAIPRGLSDASVDTVTVLYNNGSGAFPLAVHLEGRLGAYKCLAVDFDLDGWPDIAVTNIDERGLSIFPNDRTGSFPTRIDYDLTFPGPAPSGTLWIAGADLDTDGDADLAISHASKVQVIENLHCGASVVVTDTLIVTDTLVVTDTVVVCPPDSLCEGTFRVGFECDKATDGDWNTSAVPDAYCDSVSVIQEHSIPVGTTSADWIYRVLRNTSCIEVRVFYWDYAATNWTEFDAVPQNDANTTYTVPLPAGALAVSPLRTKVRVKNGGLSCGCPLQSGEYFEGVVDWNPTCPPPIVDSNCEGVFRVGFECANATDGDWNTSAVPDAYCDSVSVIQEHSIPLGTTSADWVFKVLRNTSCIEVRAFWDSASNWVQFYEVPQDNDYKTYTVPLPVGALAVSPLRTKVRVKNGGLSCGCPLQSGEFFEGVVDWNAFDSVASGDVNCNGDPDVLDVVLVVGKAFRNSSDTVCQLYKPR